MITFTSSVASLSGVDLDRLAVGRGAERRLCNFRLHSPSRSVPSGPAVACIIMRWYQVLGGSSARSDAEVYRARSTPGLRRRCIRRRSAMAGLLGTAKLLHMEQMPLTGATLARRSSARHMGASRLRRDC